MNAKLKNNINTAGTVGYVLSIIILIVLITGIVVTSMATVAACLVSKQELNVTVSSQIDIDAGKGAMERLRGFIKTDDGEDLADIFALPDGTSISVNDRELSEFSVNETEDGVSVSTKTNPVQFTAKRLIAALVVSLLYLGCLTVMFYMVKHLMKALKECDTPFSQPVIRNMQRFGYSLIPIIFMSPINSSAWGAIASGGNVIDFSLDIGVLLVIAIVFVLILVFKYGAELQQQSDETL